MGELINVLVFAGVVGIFALGGIILRKRMFGFLQSLASRTAWKGDEVIIDSIKAPFILWCILAGIFIGLNIINLPQNITSIVNKVLISVAIVSFTIVLANIAVKLSVLHASKFSTAVPLTGITRTVIYALVFSTGIMILLNTLGISITPLLTTLGIGGVAVALGLQDTLANLFAGFYVIAAKQIKLGDYIKLDSGEEGYVDDISWRTTRIKPLHNNMVLIPNSKLGQAIITNYYLPDKELMVRVDVGVHYDSDLEKVEKVTCEVAAEVMHKISGGVADFKPFIRYHTFADFSINLTVFMRAKEFVDHFFVAHEFIKALHKRYAREGIIIPYPIRAINYAQEKAVKE